MVTEQRVIKLDHVMTSKKGRKAYLDEEGNLYLDCGGCNVPVHEDAFYSRKRGFLGKRNKCKRCVKAYQEANYYRLSAFI